VDTAKYHGDLFYLPFQPDQQSGKLGDSYTVSFYGIEVESGSGKTLFSGNVSVPVVLDSGASSIALPDVIVNPIAIGLGAAMTQGGSYLVPCKLADYAGTIKFRFGNADGPYIAINISSLVSPFRNTTLTGPFPPLEWNDGTEICQLGLSPASNIGVNLLGDPFLRNAYVVYHQEAQTLAIGQTNFNATDSNVVAITAVDSVPGATIVASGAPQYTDNGYTASESPSALGNYPPTATFDLGSATATAGSGSGGSNSSPHPGAAAVGAPAPSLSFVGALFGGVSVLVGLLGGSMLVLV
jgi:Eukaryotic aspartyl protease